MTKEKKDTLLGFIALIFVLLLSAGMTTFVVIHTNNKRNKLAENPPTINEVEERLEEVFYTTDVIVFEMYDNYETTAIYTVKANGFYYRVRFSIHSAMLDYWWDYNDYVLVAESSRKNTKRKKPQKMGFCS